MSDTEVGTSLTFSIICWNDFGNRGEREERGGGVCYFGLTKLNFFFGPISKKLTYEQIEPLYGLVMAFPCTKDIHDVDVSPQHKPQFCC